jgi:hypothetical protein
MLSGVTGKVPQGGPHREHPAAAPPTLTPAPPLPQTPPATSAPEGWSFRDIEEEYRVDPVTGEGRWVQVGGTRGRFGRKPQGLDDWGGGGGGGAGGGGGGAKGPGRRKKRVDSDEDFDDEFTESD